jgi:hypothetical protein
MSAAGGETTWISVDQQMPEEGVDVVVYCPDEPDGEFQVCCCEKSPCFPGEWRFFRRDYKAFFGVTHWMPIPDLPEDAE